MLALLREKFEDAGHGSMTRVERRLGLGRNTFSNTFSGDRKSFDIGLLIATLEALGIEVGDFFEELDDPDRMPRVRARELQAIASKFSGGR